LRAEPGRARRVFWGFADQALSSLTNFILAIAVARSAGTTAFGVFSLVFATYLVCLSLSRAVATEPLSVRYSAVGPDDWRRGTGAATGTALVVGAIAGFACLIGGFVIGGSAGTTLAVLGVGLPLLLLQDAWRYAFFATRRGAAAFGNDMLWAIVLGAGLVVLMVEDVASMDAFIAVWAIGAGVGAFFGVIQSGVVPRPDRVMAWRREHADIAPRFAAEALVISGTQYATVALIGLFTGLAVVGTVRAGYVLMNAVHVATYGIQLFAIPEAVRIRNRSLSGLIRFCVLLSVMLALVALGWGAFLLLLPESIGRTLLAGTWDDARSVVLPLSVLMAAGGIQAGAFVGLRAMASAKSSLRARLTSSLLLLSGGLGGAILGGAVAAAWGMALGSAIGAASWWLHLRQAAAVESARAANP